MFAILSVCFYLAYAIRINTMLLQKKTNVVAVTRVLWAINNVTVFVSLLAAKEFSWYFLVLTINCILIAILAIRNGNADLSTTNIICAIISIAGIVLGLIFRSPIAALLCSALVSLFSTLPMYKVIWKNPKEEDLLSWVFNYVALWCGTFALQSWTATTLCVPVFWILLGTINMVLLCRPQGNNIDGTKNR